jgi:hypothetical protein
MAEIRAEAQRINSEIAAFQEAFHSKAAEAQSGFSHFQSIEDQCADRNLEFCLTQHDDFKLKRAELLRRRHRTTTTFQRKCVELLPKQWDWQKPLPILSQSEVKSASAFLTCYQSFMKQLLQSADEESALFKEAIRRLQPMVPSRPS